MLKAQVFYLDTFLETRSNKDPGIAAKQVQYRIIRWELEYPGLIPDSNIAALLCYILTVQSSNAVFQKGYDLPMFGDNCIRGTSNNVMKDQVLEDYTAKK